MEDSKILFEAVTKKTGVPSCRTFYKAKDMTKATQKRGE